MNDHQSPSHTEPDPDGSSTDVDRGSETGGHDDGGGGSGDGGRPRTGFFKWLPWEKLSIWALFLFLVWSLREFFLVIFLTFIFSYIMTSVVRSAIRIFAPGHDRQWLHRVLVTVSFLLLLGSLYGLVVFLKEPFKEQINRMVLRIRSLDVQPQTIWDDLARETIGQWRYNKLYNDAEGREREEEDLAAFREDKYQSTELERFRSLKENVTTLLRKEVVEKRGEAAFRRLQASNSVPDALRDWIRETRASDIYLAAVEEWNERYDQDYARNHGAVRAIGTEPSLEDHKQDRVTYEAARNDWVLNQIANQEMDVPDEAFNALIDDFKDYLGEKAWNELVDSERYEEEFRALYEKITEFDKDSYPYEKFVALDAALQKGEEHFQEALVKEADPEQLEKEIRESFRRTRQTALANEVLEDWKFLQIEDLKKKVQDQIPTLAGVVGQFARDLAQFVVYFTLSLLLSFFIAFDLPRIKKGIARLERSRVRDFYNEIAPGLAAFGSLIGRAFQAQGVIAICNTLLTFVLIRILELDFEIFLCTIVFFCSFIPVLGVVLSTIPIALIALVDKGLMASVGAVVGILVIHFIETSILNPKILGEMLHLHPVLVLGILVVGEHYFGVWGLLLGVPIMVYIIRYVILNEGPLPSATAAVAAQRPAAAKGRRAPSEREQTVAAK